MVMNLKYSSCNDNKDVRGRIFKKNRALSALLVGTVDVVVETNPPRICRRSAHKHKHKLAEFSAGVVVRVSPDNDGDDNANHDPIRRLDVAGVFCVC